MGQIVERLNQAGLGQLADGTHLERVLPGEEVEPLPDGTARIITPVAWRLYTSPSPRDQGERRLPPSA